MKPSCYSDYLLRIILIINTLITENRVYIIYKLNLSLKLAFQFTYYFNEQKYCNNSSYNNNDYIFVMENKYYQRCLSNHNFKCYN